MIRQFLFNDEIIFYLFLFLRSQAESLKRCTKYRGSGGVGGGGGMFLFLLHFFPAREIISSVFEGGDAGDLGLHVVTGLESSLD